MDEQLLDMLITVGVRAEYIKLLDGVQPEELFLIQNAKHAILDSGATRTIVPSANYLVRGALYVLPKPLSFKGYDKESSVSVAVHGGYIALKSNTGMPGSLLVQAVVLPTARKPLISVSQLDDIGCFVTLGGGGLRLKRGRRVIFFGTTPSRP